VCNDTANTKTKPAFRILRMTFSPLLLFVACPKTLAWRLQHQDKNVTFCFNYIF
jgi:hypothetical protein